MRNEVKLARVQGRALQYSSINCNLPYEFTDCDTIFAIIYQKNII